MNMEALISIMNNLHDIFNTIGTDCMQLPQIVVIGTQSSGKSSVLESLVGRDFLPRGPGIVTRCPLILQLIYTPQDAPFRSSDNGTENLEEWGKFIHTGNKVYADFNAIRNEIEEETCKISGKNKGISSEALNLKIFSPRVINLTLIDLPGITKVPVGDQPDNIEIQIKQLILQYIENPNAIILAVTPANTDFSTSESLKLAKKCDPQGRRTLAVITKLDLMDAGTDAFDVLCGRIIPVKLGIIGVVNRSQQDTIDSKTISDAMKDEALFLEKYYPTLASKNGTPFLGKTLHRLLMNHIRHCLPSLKTRINKMVAHYQALLLSYGKTVTNYNHTLLKIITRFVSAYCSTIEGTSKNIKTTELSGGARICYIFHEMFARTLNDIDPLGGLGSWDILTAIRNATGTKPALFIPEVAFELLVKRQIKRLKDPSLRCVQLVYNEMQRIVQHSCTEFQHEINRFPKLHEKIADVVTQLLQRCLPETNQMVRSLVEIELAYINTKHPDFYGYPTEVSITKTGVNNANACDMENVNEVSDIISKLHQEFPESAKNDYNYCEPKVTEMNLELEKSYELEIIAAKDSDKRNKSKADWFKTIRKSLSFQTNVESTNERPFSTLGSFNSSTSPDSLLSEKAFNHARYLTDSEKKDCETIERLIHSYFKIVKKNIQDAVPKAIMHFLVNFVQVNLQSELVTQLYNKENSSSLLQESEQVTTGRKEAEEMLEALQKAVQIISIIRDTSL